MERTLRQKLHIVLRHLELGFEIKTSRGYVLVFPEGSDEPGFLMESFDTKTGETKEIVVQIGSDVAWMALIHYAKTVSSDDLTIMASENALTEINRERIK